MAFFGRNENLCDASETAVFPAGMAVPGGMDDVIFGDGFGECMGCGDNEQKTNGAECTVAVRCTVGGKFFLVYFLFSLFFIFVFFLLVAFVVGVGAGDNGMVLSSEASGRSFVAPLFALDYLCRIFEFWNLGT